MKKLLFGLCSLTLIFTSCSQECFLDTQDESSYEELLIKKSKEFAQKYNINLEIDKEALSSLNHSFTIEEMEEFYKNLANCYAQDQATIKWTSEEKGKLHIKRRISLGEAALTPPGDSSAQFKFTSQSTVNGKIVTHNFLTINSTVSWEQPAMEHGACFFESGSNCFSGETEHRGRRIISGNFRGNKKGVADFGIGVNLPAPFKTYSFSVHFAFEGNSAYWSISPSYLNDSISTVGTGTLNSTVHYYTDDL